MDEQDDFSKVFSLTLVTLVLLALLGFYSAIYQKNAKYRML